MGKKFLKKLQFKLGMDLQKGKNKAGMGKLKNTTLLWNDGGLLSGFQRNLLASLVHYVACKMN